MFDTRGEYRLSCEHLGYLSPSLSSFSLQFASEAAFLSCICTIIVFVWIGVCPNSIRVFIPIDEMSRSGTYTGIGERFRMGVGRCFRGLLIYTWSA